ncbi:MAG: YdcF family protein [Bacteroidia bacterium]|jgi:uncharacterized SAM-binding protein YcdF (DUF218 family)|nr:YdcF family protein [Bacteroidia bacterium]
MLRKIYSFLKKPFRKIFLALGIAFLLFLIFAFTTGPFWMYYNLGASEAKIKQTPETIVLMGGGGFPGESNLMRAYYALKAAKAYPHAALILALPGMSSDSTSSVFLFRKYLIEQGLDSTRIRLECKGKNTRGQCLEIYPMVNMYKPILVISSPEHLRRSVKCFRKLGFYHVNGLPAFEKAIEADLFFVDKKLGGRKIPGTDVGSNLQVRYQFWTHLRYEVIVMREYLAIFYYKLKGWM